MAAFLSDSFECAWEGVRPVPRLTIDFGDGHTLERTLRGNIATYVCTSEGETLDLVPGLMDAAEYERRLEQSKRLFERMHEARATDERGPAEVLALVERWHSVRSRSAAMQPGTTDAIALELEALLSTPAGSAAPAFDARGLELDTRIAREEGHRLAHAFLARHALVPPAQLTRDVYRELLHVDLDDPALGLAPGTSDAFDHR